MLVVGVVLSPSCSKCMDCAVSIMMLCSPPVAVKYTPAGCVMMSKNLIGLIDIVSQRSSVGSVLLDNQ